MIFLSFNSCQLAIECGVGIAVLVLCFVDRKATEDRIVERLGNGFSRAPFITVVVRLPSNYLCFIGDVIPKLFIYLFVSKDFMVLLMKN